jgi:thiamine kinase-like enzyme
VRPIIRRRRLAVVREMFRPPLTMVHGDCHLENIFFGEHFEARRQRTPPLHPLRPLHPPSTPLRPWQGGCSFIDFGLTSFGKGVADVAMILAQGMSVEARRKHEVELLKHYHASLLEYGVKDYSWETCYYDFQINLFRPLVSLLTIAPNFAKQRKARVGMFAPTLSEGDATLAALYHEINHRLATALLDHKWHEIIAELPLTANKYMRPCS